MKDNTTCNTPIKIFNCSNIRPLPVAVKFRCILLALVQVVGHCLNVAFVARLSTSRLHPAVASIILWSLSGSLQQTNELWNRAVTCVRIAASVNRIVAVTFLSLVAAHLCHWPIRLQR
jgi:hypothetical protein